MTPEARRIYNAIQRQLRQSSCQTAPEVTEQPAAAFPPGLGDARMRRELESYFRVQCFSWGFNDSDAGSPEEYESGVDDKPVQAFEFVDPETLKTRPQNLTQEEADRWDMFDAENNARRNYYEPLATPAEIDYLASLARLDRANGVRYLSEDYRNGAPSLLDQFQSLTAKKPTPETMYKRGCGKRKINTFEAISR